MFFDRWKLETRNAGGLFEVQVPSRLESHAGGEDAEWITLNFDRIHSWAMGSQTPYRTRLQVLVFAPGTAPARQRALLEQAPTGLDQCRDIRWLGHEARGSGEWSVGECLHAVNSLEEPSWIVAVYETAKGCRLSLRVWKKDLDLAKARDLLSQAAASFKTLPGLPAKFEEIRGGPGRAAEAAVLRVEALGQALAAQGFPKPRAGHAEEHGGFIYLLTDDEERDFTIGRFLGMMTPASPPVNESLPGELGSGGIQLRDEAGLFWFVHQEGEWRQHSMHAGYFIPEPIVKRISRRHTEAGRAYFYDFSAVRLRDATSWEPAGLLKWMERARLAEQQFSRGQIVTPHGR